MACRAETRRRGARIRVRTGFAALRLAGPAALLLVLPLPGAARQVQPSPEDLYVQRFGCAACHGRAGEGGMGPALHGTGLPLADFVRGVRMPANMMPPFNHAIISDAELAAIYAWLRGREALAPRLPVLVSLADDGPLAAGVDADLAFEARLATAPSGSTAPVRPTHFRITLLARDDARAVGQRIGYRLPGAAGWTYVATDDRGRALLAPGSGFSAAELDGGNGIHHRIRVNLPEGGFAIVVEAVDASDPAEPLILGFGSRILTVR